MKSWSPWFARRVERKRRLKPLKGGNVVIHGFPAQGPIFPGGGPVAPWQQDLIHRITAENAILRARVRCPGRRLT